MLCARLLRLHKTSGGSKETELNEFAVNPKKLPSGRQVVMMVTPVANCDRACRYRRWSKSGASAMVDDMVGRGSKVVSELRVQFLA